MCSSYVPRAVLFFCVAKKRTKERAKLKKAAQPHMQTTRPLPTFIGMSCPIGPLAIKASLMIELIAKAHGI
jgi:hypothetical protein